MSAGCCGDRTRTGRVQRAGEPALRRRINEAGGEVLLDQRVRRVGSHHQKLVVIRHRGHPDRDVAFVGGIDLCHGRGDDERTRRPAGDRFRPALRSAPAVARHPARGPRAGRRRPRAHLPRALARPAARSTESVRRQLDRADDAAAMPDALPPAGRRPAAGRLARRSGAAHVPAKRPATPSLHAGERSIARAYLKAFARARRLIYLEDQYLWSRDVADAARDALLRTRQQLVSWSWSALPRRGRSRLRCRSTASVSSASDSAALRGRRPGAVYDLENDRRHADLRAREGRASSTTCG